MKYRYTMLNQDGTKTEIGTFAKELPFKTVVNQKTGEVTKGLYTYLKCSTIELIPEDYYVHQNKINVELGGPITAMFGDEEGRYDKSNIRNPWFGFFDTPNGVFDVVGNIIAVEELR